MTKPPLAPDLEDISRRTLDSYVQRAESFWEGTRNHDVSENVSALLAEHPRAAAVHPARFRLRARDAT